MKNKKLMLLLCAMTLGAWLCPLHADTGPQKKLTRDAYVIWDPQILEPSQLSSNSDAGSAESSSLSYLIDNDASTVFHSVWHTDMKLADETVEKWLAALATITGVTNTDPGYHNLQVRLNEPVTEFRFEYKGRNNDTYHDNPNHIAIYSTNDQIVAQNTSNSNQDQWEFITEFMTTGINQVETGYYNIVNTNPQFMTLQGTTMSMYVNSQKQLGWTKSDSLNAAQLWYIEKLDSARYSIKNVASGEYIGSVKGQSMFVPMAPAHVTDQIIEWLPQYPGQFNIYNVENAYDYCINGHGDGTGTGGRIDTWDGTGNSNSAWLFRHVTDQELIDKLVAEGPQAIMASAMNLALDSANASRNKANEYTKLITRAEQINSNANDPASGSFANLIDNNTGTIFHSMWSDAFKSPTELGTSYGWHNLQFTLDEPVSSIRFDFTARVTSDGWIDTPNHITLYATNDDALGASTAAADSSKWVEIVDMTKEEYNFPIHQSGAVYNSPIIDLGGDYKYLRFVVKHTTGVEPGNNRAGGFVSPQATGITFNLSEFQIYDSTPTEKSQYYTVPGMKEACDALEQAMTTAQEKLAVGTVTEADIEALQKAYRLVDTLYVDRPALFGQLKSLLETGKNLVDVAKGSRVALISNVSQLNTNSDQDATSQLPNLIDGNTDTYFHSIWNTGMADPSLTEEMWLDSIYELFPMSTGSGYHNLSVELMSPVSSFNFEYYSRNEANWHDNPNDIEIYATNDPELFADVRASTTSEWTKITELTEGFPTGLALEVPYMSPNIDLKGEYKYIRFVIKNTCLANNPDGNTTIGDTRNFAVPDITGITWNCSEFQMYSGLAPESIQYNYIPEVKEAADAFEVLYEQYSGYTESDINSGTPVEELTAALVKLQDAYVDTTAVCSLYNAYKEITAREIYEGDLPGDVDDESAIETFNTQLDEARALIDPVSPLKAQVNSAMEMINTGYEEFMSHVILPQPYVWYVIRSGVTSESYPYAVNQPIFLDNVSVGGSLRIGGYEIGNEYQDVYDIWRLVPVESNEPVAEGEEIKPWEQTFAIQSLGTGQYWGKYRGQGTANGPQMESEPTPYHIYFYGNGCFALQQEGVKDPFDRIKADGTDLMICNYPANSGDQQSWKFEDALENGADVVAINWFPANTTSIITLPFDLTGDNSLYNLNGDIETYAVNSVVEGESAEGDEPSYTLTLTAKEEFEAGEPFVIVTLAEPDENGQQPLWFNLPPAEANAIVDTSAVDYNGLVGTLQGLTIKGQASLYFLNSVLNVATDAGYSIAGRGGYIDVTKVKDLGGSIDKTITINGIINDIKNVEIVETENEIVDVYTIDGVLVKRNVKAAEATRNLAKGIYIVGKKKVLVK